MTQLDLANSQKAIDDAIAFMDSKGIGAGSEWFWHYIKRRRISFARKLLSIAEAQAAPARIVDFGAAPFVVDQALAQLGYDVTAVDLAPDRFAAVDNLAVDLVKADVEDPPQYRDTLADFDLAVLSHVFEHMRVNLPATLHGIRSSLRPGGRLLLETPNLLSAQGWLNLVKHQRAYSCAQSLAHEWNKIESVGHMGHVREYTAAEVCEMLEASGFSIESITFMDRANGRSLKHRLISLLQSVVKNMRQNIRIVARAP